MVVLVVFGPAFKRTGVYVVVLRVIVVWRLLPLLRPSVAAVVAVTTGLVTLVLAALVKRAAIDKVFPP